ncbi:MAG: sodium/proline symporter PutP [Treponema porcinum]|uniref:sodium/proline symporter PutP n=1 Tax=Treponema porcinum TaxID=261392 RepID=UPI0023543BCA|nr:sodium/proline symporter PutP [Treponema porcinum]MCI6180420.1 sodium/proline symporter PutP [Treponema porcinum]MCI6323263.1 sodium/proline symporter PutP [Treponema porcinum]MCI7080717.1 sodium/proline symporter PutP [Treponema porcinum]MCI7533581.1 sodium/proline symporter PutP [Treponema porcinum]MDD6899366.1 sodium/proline symporter PutP [Treponema porcinum]
MSAQIVAKIIAFVLYLGFMVYIGLRSAKKNNSSMDFFLGGRKVGPWITALSAEASDSSAWLLMGLPGLCYLGGVKETFWTAVGLIVGTYLNWLFVAKPLRKCTISFGDSITIPEFFTNRFKDKTHLLTIISVFFIVLFFTIYTASGFVACAKLFNSVFGLKYHIGLVIGLVVILSYTILGGYLAVCTTDFIQGALIFVAFVFSAVIAVVSLGGPAEAMAKVSDFSVRAVNGQFGAEMAEKFIANKSFSVMSVISALAWGLGYFGMPHIIIRFMGIRSNAEIKTARRVGTVWMVIAYIGTFIIGSLGTVYLAGGDLANPLMILSGGAEETVFSATMQQMYPAFIAGLFLCAILAASMSTADSQLLSASSAVSLDIYKGLINKDADEKTVMNVSRITVLVIAAIAFVLSLNPSSSIFGLVSYAWAGFGSTFGPLVILALFWRGMTNKGAIAGLIAGGVTVVLWHNLKGGIFNVYEILPGFIACLVFAVAVSLLDRNKNPEMLAEFDAYKKMED